MVTLPRPLPCPLTPPSHLQAQHLSTAGSELRLSGLGGSGCHSGRLQFCRMARQLLLQLLMGRLQVNRGGRGSWHQRNKEEKRMPAAWGG